MKIQINRPIDFEDNELEDLVSNIHETPLDGELNVDINSPGGRIDQALHIYNAFVDRWENGGKTTMTITGVAASAASWILMGATTRQARQNTTFAIHNGITRVQGHKEDFLFVHDWLEKVDNQMAEMYVAETGISMDQITDWMNGPRGDGVRFTAQEAKKHGFIDTVLPLKSQNNGNSKGITNMIRRRPEKIQILNTGNCGSKCGCSRIQNGNSLAALLNRTIDSMVENSERTRSDVIRSMASAAGIAPGTVNNILQGFDDSDPEHPVGINCPPEPRLRGFARVLPITFAEILRAAERDGCDYGREENSAKARQRQRMRMDLN